MLLAPAGDVWYNRRHCRGACTAAPATLMALGTAKLRGLAHGRRAVAMCYSESVVEVGVKVGGAERGPESASTVPTLSGASRECANSA